MASERYELYDGKVTLIYKGGRYHYYDVEDDGKLYKRPASVTGITGVLDKPALKFWAANIGGDAVEKLLVPGLVIDEFKQAEIAQAARMAHRTVTTTTAAVGTKVHEWIEAYIDSSLGLCEYPEPAVNEHIKNSIDQFLVWEKENNVEWLASELKVYSRKYRYVGTLDSEAIVAGKLTLVDLKTSSGIYPEMFLQVAGYAKARQEETGKKYEQLCILRIPRDGDSFETKTDTRIDKHYRAFLGCRQAYLWSKAMKKEWKQ